ncbi:PD-(D/E)XK nuclease-like domain-containing protein [Cryobacterium melibiosiphilum]|nr:PD-(D/E)XK nuclease-like domain-containing protein [Cryobacterium melibiosiphilum]
MPETPYHAHPALSSTQARLLLDSPARFHYSKTHPQGHKDAFDLGTAVHTKVLGVGSQAIAYPDEHLTPSGMVSSKAATIEWVAEQRANGLIVLSADKLAEVNAMSEAVLAHPTAKILFEQDGNSEASIFATDPETGVELRARFDFLPNLANNHPIAVDLKTTGKSASREGFEKSVASFGYDVQQGHYLPTLELVVGRELPMVFVVVETAAPHLVAVHQLDQLWHEMGMTKARKAREIFAECTANNEWPGYPTGVELISPPTWAVYQHEEKYA